MHELGVVMEVVKAVEEFAAENGLTEIESLTLEIGELSSMVPRYVEACFPAAAEGTLLEHARLVIETVRGNGRCRGCGKIFHVLSNEGKCPFCGEERPEALGGLEFNIREIKAR